MRSNFAILGVLAAATAHPCITLYGAAPGRAPVTVANETAVIVWDPRTKTEHFIRTATFDGVAGDLGFLVPTPSAPRLTSLADRQFEHGLAIKELENQIAPKVVEKKRPVYRLSDDWSITLPGRAAHKTLQQIALAGTMYMGDVDEVFRGQVGSYDAAVLRANDSQALLKWLAKNRFPSDARLETWLEPYVRRGWAITAFRYAPKTKTYTSEPVCLSFKTNRPFYPYREPEATNSPASRSLRVYVVAPGRQVGQLENGPWPTTAEHAAPLAQRGVDRLALGFGLSEDAFKDQWLTSFLDRRPIRPASELYFEKDSNQTPVAVPPVVKWVDDPIFVSKGLVATASAIPIGLTGLIFLRRSRRGRKRL